jgi:hypothetical protein
MVEWIDLSSGTWFNGMVSLIQPFQDLISFGAQVLAASLVLGLFLRVVRGRGG